jgi:PAS domain S-box-containing protein
LPTSDNDALPAAAARSELKFEGLLEAAPDAMVIVDQRGRIALVNSETERLFGYSRAELLGRPVELLVPAVLRDVHSSHREKFIGDPHRRMMGIGLQLAGRRRDGTQFPVEISLSPVHTADGMLVTAAVRDITSRIHVENALKSTNDELESFTYSVSHDLRAPIRQIDGFARILLERVGNRLGDDERHYLKRILDGASHMGRLVDDLLNLSRIGRQGLRPAMVSLNSVVDQAIAELANDTGGREIEWRIGPLPTILCDPGLMKVALANLLSNALKYTRGRAPAIIEIGIVKDVHQPTVFVRDNGVGFDMKYADKLFGVFQRLHGVDEFPGTGVGLATVHRIINKHGGDIWADAAPGQGATFTFTIGAVEGTREV